MKGKIISRLEKNKRLFKVFSLVTLALDFYSRLIKNNKKLIGVILLTLILFAFGFYFLRQPDWLRRQDIESYNLGVEEYRNFEKVKEQAYLASLFFKSAQANFYQTTLLSTDDKLKSLAFYNWGTMIGEMALDKKLSLTERIKISQMAIELLEKAVRLDPENEEAKYNLEFLKNLQKELFQQLQEAVGKKEGELQPQPGQPGKGRGERGY